MVSVRYGIISIVVMIAISCGLLYWSYSSKHTQTDLYATGSSRAAVPSHCNCVAFRLDDIRDKSFVQGQQAVISEFQKNHTPLTIGIIANQFGNDDSMSPFVRSLLNDSNIEIANHGWNHEDFASYNEAQQEELMKEANARIGDILGVTPTTFISPFNAINSQTLLAAKASGISHVSAGISPSETYPIVDSYGITEVPGTIAAGHLDSHSATGWSTFDATYTMNHIKSDIKTFGFAVVVLHPLVFADQHGNINTSELKELQKLINLVNNSNYKPVLLGQIKA